MTTLNFTRTSQVETITNKINANDKTSVILLPIAAPEKADFNWLNVEADYISHEAHNIKVRATRELKLSCTPTEKEKAIPFDGDNHVHVSSTRFIDEYKESNDFTTGHIKYKNGMRVVGLEPIEKPSWYQEPLDPNYRFEGEDLKQEVYLFEDYDQTTARQYKYMDWSDDTYQALHKSVLRNIQTELENRSLDEGIASPVLLEQKKSIETLISEWNNDLAKLRSERQDRISQQKKCQKEMSQARKRLKAAEKKKSTALKASGVTYEKMKAIDLAIENNKKQIEKTETCLTIIDQAISSINQDIKNTEQAIHSLSNRLDLKKQIIEKAQTASEVPDILQPRSELADVQAELELIDIELSRCINLVEHRELKKRAEPFIHEADSLKQKIRQLSSTLDEDSCLRNRRNALLNFKKTPSRQMDRLIEEETAYFKSGQTYGVYPVQLTNNTKIASHLDIEQIKFWDVGRFNPDWSKAIVIRDTMEASGMDWKALKDWKTEAKKINRQRILSAPLSNWDDKKSQKTREVLLGVFLPDNVSRKMVKKHSKLNESSLYFALSKLHPDLLDFFKDKTELFDKTEMTFKEYIMEIVKPEMASAVNEARLPLSYSNGVVDQSYSPVSINNQESILAIKEMALESDVDPEQLLEAYLSTNDHDSGYVANEFFLRDVRKDEYEEEQLFHETYGVDEEDQDDFDSWDDSTQNHDMADLWLEKNDPERIESKSYNEIIELSKAISHPTSKGVDEYSRWSAVKTPVDMLPFGYWNADKVIKTDPVYSYKPEVFIPILMKVKQAKTVADLDLVCADVQKFKFDQGHMIQKYYKMRRNQLAR